MTTQTGLRYEHDKANELDEVTGVDIRAYRCGYSGNSKFPQPDVLVTSPTGNYALELKRTKKEKGFNIEDDDVQQLYDCQNAHTDGWFGVKFNHRELCLFQLPSVPHGESMMDAVCTVVPDELNPRVGSKSNNLIVNKPSLDSWESASAGHSDVSCIIGTLGLGAYASSSATIVSRSEQTKVTA